MKSIILDNMILQRGNKILRKVAEKAVDAKAAETKALIERMAEAMFKEPDGVGIAAPQIGVALQIFLVAKDLLRPSTSPRKTSEEGDIFPALPAGKPRKKAYLTFINPIIKKFSQKKIKDVEGCLSVRGVYGEVTRPEKLTIEYLDESGKKRSRGASGLLARVIQHEVDHLNGVLFIDKAVNLKTYNMKHET